MREHVIALALKLAGCPYIWGGGNPWTGLDCSGFVVWIFQVFGLLPSGDWTAQGLYTRFGPGSAPGVKDMEAGDLVFYGMAPRTITHVMLAVSDKLVVGASGGGSTTTTVEEARRRGAQVKVKPVNYRSDLVAVVPVEMPEK